MCVCVYVCVCMFACVFACVCLCMCTRASAASVFMRCLMIIVVNFMANTDMDLENEELSIM